MSNFLEQITHNEPMIIPYKMKQSSTNMIHRKFKFPEIEGNVRPARSRGSPTSSRNNISQEKDMSLDGGNSYQSFKIRTFKPVERSETPKEINMTKSTQVRSRNFQNDEYTEHKEDEIQLPKIYSPITTPRTIMGCKMKESIFKPLLSRAQTIQTIENVISIKFQNKMYDQLKKGTNVKCLYFSERMDESINKIIIIHFDFIFLHQRKSFWENQTEITICSSVLGTTCESQYCSCALPKDLKQTFNLISKSYFIVLLFECKIRGQIWQKYLIENGFQVDSIYYLPIQKQSKGGLKLKQVVQNFKDSNIELLLYLGVAHSEASYIKIPIEQLYHQIPILPQQIETQIYLFNFHKQKTIDAKILQNICLVAKSKGDTFNHTKPLTFVNLDLQPIIQEMIKIEEEDEVTNMIFKQLQKEENQEEELEESIELEEDDKNLQMVWLYSTKKLIQDYFKSLNLEEHHVNPYTLIGDILRRNSYIELNFQNQSYDLQARKYRLYCQLKTQTVSQSVFRKQVPIECFIIYD